MSGVGPLRNAVEFGQDPLGFLDARRGGKTQFEEARFVVGPTLTFVFDPDLVRSVLITHHERYKRPDILSSRTESLTANGLIQTDGALWERQRSTLNPLFGRERIQTYASTIGEVTANTAMRWENGRQLDLYEEMVKVTVRVIAQTLFSVDPSDEEIGKFVSATETIANEFEVTPVALLRQFLPTPPSQGYQRTIQEMHHWAEEVISDRRNNPDRPEDMITALLDSEEPDDPPNLIRDEVLTFLFAGHETTALTLAFAFWYLSQHPEVAERARSEAQAVLDGNQPTFEHLSELSYIERVIRESMRLRPASWAIFREAKVESPLGNRRIREGDYLLLPQWALHRDPRYFDSPETFDPDRWNSIEPSKTPAYFPFGAGPHVCIGGQLALTEAQLVLAALLSQFEFEVDPTAGDNLRPAGVLQPRDGIPATVRKLN
jgi:cytochrome P450